mmetsp:Transcript_24016/g.51232  ORF Transcript_24016/g.51232 Transcript_24016/m.51232 type:complete len:203 (-) Transcript_24016:386-994(-)
MTAPKTTLVWGWCRRALEGATQTLQPQLPTHRRQVVPCQLVLVSVVVLVVLAVALVAVVLSRELCGSDTSTALLEPLSRRRRRPHRWLRHVEKHRTWTVGCAATTSKQLQCDSSSRWGHLHCRWWMRCCLLRCLRHAMRNHLHSPLSKAKAIRARGGEDWSLPCLLKRWNEALSGCCSSCTLTRLRILLLRRPSRSLHPLCV